MATAQKMRTLTTGSASGCWACCSRAAETTSWKSRSKMELTASFQLVKNVLNYYCLVCFLRNNHFWTQTNGAENQISSYLSQVLCTRATCFSWFYSTNIIQPFQIKGQYNRPVLTAFLPIIIQPFQIKGQYNGQVRSVRLVLIITPFQFKGQYNLNISKDTFVIMRHRPPLFTSISLQFFSIHFPKMPCQFSWRYVLIKR